MIKKAKTDENGEAKLGSVRVNQIFKEDEEGE